MLKNQEKFNGKNFKRWQHKLFFYLTTLNLARFLKETAPQVEPPRECQPSNAQAVQATTSAKELWESLERKYKTKDAGTKKFVVLLHDIHAEGMTLSETFQVASIIEKLPPSWVEFKNYLKHKRKEMSVEDLVVDVRGLQTEVLLSPRQDNKLAQKNTYTPDFAKDNMVEHAGSSSKSNSKGKGKDKRKNEKKSKGKAVYLAPKAGIMKQKAIDNGEKLYMGNSATTDIKGKGDVILKMTSEKELKLTNSHKFVLSKNQMYVGKGYALNADRIDKEVGKELDQRGIVVGIDYCGGADEGYNGVNEGQGGAVDYYYGADGTTMRLGEEMKK
ncbi:hypothetical protein Tco_1337220 [Tanacetum coccineum]